MSPGEAGIEWVAMSGEGEKAEVWMLPLSTKQNDIYTCSPPRGESTEDCNAPMPKHRGRHACR